MRVVILFRDDVLKLINRSLKMRISNTGFTLMVCLCQMMANLCTVSYVQEVSEKQVRRTK